MSWHAMVKAGIKARQGVPYIVAEHMDVVDSDYHGTRYPGTGQNHG